MSIELRPKSPFFYIILMIKGRRKAIPSTIRYEGVPPEGLRMKNEGDASFERSRGRALEEEKRLKKELKSECSEEALQKKIYKAATGRVHQAVSVHQLFEISKNHVRKRKWSTEWEKQVCRIHEKFMAYLKRRHSKLEFAHEVTRIIAEDFLRDYESLSGCSAKTVNDVKTTLQGLWTVCLNLDLLSNNPFLGIAKRQHLSITKKPFTASQMIVILGEAARDPELHAMVVLSASTGMRLVDCCTLKWSSVSIETEMIGVPSQKKNQQPTLIPYFGKLKELIDAAWKQREESTYVFPHAEQIYSIDKGYFTKAFSMLLMRVGFTDDEDASKSIRVSREGGGARRTPLRSFHALKTTWITNALNAGISMEDVQRITGNVDAETILKHYFHSDGERIRQKLQSVSPSCLGGLNTSAADGCLPTDQLLKLVKQINSENWQFIAERMEREIQALAMQSKKRKAPQSGRI